MDNQGLLLYVVLEGNLKPHNFNRIFLIMTFLLLIKSSNSLIFWRDMFGTGQLV